MNIREQYEEMEKKILSPYAVLASQSEGRRTQEDKCSIRTDFQRDRDRIIHSKAFRRLKHKTQVFLTPEGDHYRTRLTHTLEVSQIARTIARALRLNEDLTEAISLGHDLGHTPFGHSGESKLNEICPHGFKHAEQSLRIVDVLEGEKGLNLTEEVRDGIVNHTGLDKAKTMEGQIVQFADRIAYINHDIDDAIRGGIIKSSELPKNSVKILGSSHSQRIGTMINAVVSASENKHCISMQQPFFDAMMELRKYMFEYVYIDSAAKEEESKAVNIIRCLYEYYLNYPEKMPKSSADDDLHRLVCDYIAGMTDSYAIAKYQEIFIPKAWHTL